MRHRWGKPAWESRWNLPVPTYTTRKGFWKVFTTRSVDVGRVNRSRAIAVLLAVAIEFFQFGVVKTLGDQFHTIGVRERPRLVDGGAYRVVRHPMYTYVFGFFFA